MHSNTGNTLDYPRSIIEAMPEGFLNLTPTGKILDVNVAYCRMSGYDRDSLIGMDVRKLEWGGSIHKVSLTATRLAYGESEVFETVHSTQKGDPFMVEITATGISQEGLKVVCFVHDIRHRTQIETSLTQISDLMRYVIEHTRSSVAIHDRQLRYMYVSQRYLDEYRITDPNIIGKHHYEVLPDLPQKWRDIHTRCLA